MQIAALPYQICISYKKYRYILLTVERGTQQPVKNKKVLLRKWSHQMKRDWATALVDWVQEMPDMFIMQKLSQFQFSVDNCSSLCHVRQVRINSQGALVVSVTRHVFPMCYFLPLVFHSRFVLENSCTLPQGEMNFRNSFMINYVPSSKPCLQPYYYIYVRER